MIRSPRFVAIKERPIPYISTLQPEKCRGCVWGEWAGSVQMCKTVECKKKEGDAKGKDRAAMTRFGL
ncbi:hypothetical protein D3C74_426260 [compost metagenome]